MSADRTPVALALDDLDRAIAGMAQHASALRILADRADHHSYMATLKVSMDAAQHTTAMLDALQAFNTAHTARADAASK